MTCSNPEEQGRFAEGPLKTPLNSLSPPTPSGLLITLGLSKYKVHKERGKEKSYVDVEGYSQLLGQLNCTFAHCFKSSSRTISQENKKF